MKIIALFGILIIIKVMMNKYSLTRLYKLEEKYKLFISKIVGCDTENKFDSSIYEMQPELVQLLKKSGITRPTVTTAIPIGYNHIRTGNVDVWDNMFVNRVDVAQLMIASIERARGVFKLRLKQTINPFYYVEGIIFLPQTILKYLGVVNINFGIKLLNLIYWILSIIYAVYSSTINAIIQNFLSSFFK